MKKTLFLAALLAGTAAFAQNGELILWYDRPAGFFEEALVIGNGRLGATIYGGVERDRISLNDITLWTGEPDRGDLHPDIAELNREKGAGPVKRVRELLDKEDYAGAEEAQKAIQGHFSESYQPLGTLYINYPEGDSERYRRQLDLNTARARTVAGSRVSEYFASAPDSAIVIRLEDPQGLDFSLEYECSQPHSITETPDGMIIDGYTAWHAYPGYYNPGEKPRMSFDENRGIHFRTVIKLIREQDIAATIIISNETSFAGFDKDPVKEGREYKEAALRLSRNAAAKPYPELKLAAETDYRRLFDRMWLRLGPDSRNELPTDERLLRYADGAEDPGLEALYFHFGRYLLISCSRTPGVPANLQGLWNESMDPPWSSNYTININLEENYWPAEAANLGELHEVLLQYLKGLSVNGKAVARDYYGVNSGWAAGHNSDIWAMATPVGLGSGDPVWANWNMGGTWLSTHIWEHYLFTRDKAFLKEYFPVLKGAAQFCMKWLIRKDGYYMTSPSTSPENIYRTPDGFVGATLYGATADIAFVRECLTDAVKASKVLGGNFLFRWKARRILKKLPPYRIGSKGNLQEWYRDWEDPEPQHRHQSHLAGLYPGHQITASDTVLAAACAKTLELRGLNTTGWSAGWRVNLLARLHDGTGSSRMLRRLLRYVSPDRYSGPDARRGGGTYPNLLDAHAPFQIDGNFGGCAGIMEMLVQSGESEIRLLPACPWEEGAVHGIKTRAGLTISFSWSGNKVDSFEILDAAPGVDAKAVEIRM